MRSFLQPSTLIGFPFVDCLSGGKPHVIPNVVYTDVADTLPHLRNCVVYGLIQVTKPL